MRRLFLFVVTLTVLGCGDYAREPDISTADFTVVSCEGQWRPHGSLSVVAEVRNDGAKAACVEVELIARDANGVLVSSDSIWLGGIRNNIPPGETRAIDYPLTRDERAVSVEVQVITAKRL